TGSGADRALFSPWHVEITGDNGTGVSADAASSALAAAAELETVVSVRVEAAAGDAPITADMTLEPSAGFREGSALPNAGSRTPISAGAVGSTDARWGSLRISAFTSGLGERAASMDSISRLLLNR